MIEKRPILLLVSAAALTLALHQGAIAETAPGPASAEADATASAVPSPAEPGTGQPSPEGPTPADAAPADSPPADPTSPDPSPGEPTPEDSGASGVSPGASPADAATAPEEAVSPAPAEASDPMAAAHERMEQRQAEMMAERRRQYDQLRARAAEMGLLFPETPPWETAAMAAPEMPAFPEMPAPPEMPAAPDMPAFPQMPASPDMQAPPPTLGADLPRARGGMSQAERDAVREQRYQAMRERAKAQGIEMPEMPPWKLMTEEEREARRQMMRTLTPEQRRAIREQHWQELRERGQQQGIEMPETPPWKQAEQRREEMHQRREAYRQIVEQMSAEQREAAAAVFGQPPAAPELPAMPMQPPAMPDYHGMPDFMPQGPMPQPWGAPGYGAQRQMPPSWGMPGYGGQGAMPKGPMMPGYGGQGRMPQMPGGYWQGSDRQRYQGPPPPDMGYGQGW